MEGSGSKKMRAICVILVIMLGMFARESDAFSGKCYGKCLFHCVINPFHYPAECAIKCLFKCIFEPPGSPAPAPDSVTSLSLNDPLHNQCTFRCAKTKCAYITTSAQNIREDEVEDCVNNCSNTCIKKTIAPTIAPTPALRLVCVGSGEYVALMLIEGH